MKIYSDSNPPKSGKGKKIFEALTKAGFCFKDLHYNPNCWGKAESNGWGTWACEITKNPITYIRQICYSFVGGYQKKELHIL